MNVFICIPVCISAPLRRHSSSVQLTPAHQTQREIYETRRRPESLCCVWELCEKFLWAIKAENAAEHISLSVLRNHCEMKNHLTSRIFSQNNPRGCSVQRVNTRDNSLLPCLAEKEQHGLPELNKCGPLHSLTKKRASHIRYVVACVQLRNSTRFKNL